MRKKFTEVLTEYGVIAVILYFAMFFAVLFGAYFALKAGWTPKGFAAETGRWVVAYGIAKLSTPIRLAATVALSPLIARIWERMRGHRRAAVIPPPDSET